MTEAGLATKLRAVGRSLLESCETVQKQEMAHELDSVNLRRWTYLPRSRPGLLLGDMQKSQRLLVHKILSLLLSESCHAQIATIMAMEDILDHREGHRRGRHATDFSFLIFGDPGGDGIWAMRLEGHHLCVHATVSVDQVTLGPVFLGCRPAVVRNGDRIVTAPLLHEEILARGILTELPPEQYSKAHVCGDSPPDIYTGNSGLISCSPPPVNGIHVSEMERKGQVAVRKLLRLYAERLSVSLQENLFDRLCSDNLTFAWEGGTREEQDHYYRLAGRTSVIEYSNSNCASHVHNVIRNCEQDFGDNFLASH